MPKSKSKENIRFRKIKLVYLKVKFLNFDLQWFEYPDVNINRI